MHHIPADSAHANVVFNRHISMCDGGSRAGYGYEEEGQEGEAYLNHTLNHDVIR
jgi:hypothetical protein